MLLTIRILSALVGIALVVGIFTGVMAIELFVVPDYLAAGLLVAAAAVPQPALARQLLFGANGFALGVFSVAIMRFIQAGESVSVGLLATTAISLLCAVALIVRPAARSQD